MSGYTTSNKKAHTLLYGVLFCVRNIPRDAILSFTYDNGSENTDHLEINRRVLFRFCAMCLLNNRRIATRYFRIIEPMLEKNTYENWGNILQDMRMIKSKKEIEL